MGPGVHYTLTREWAREAGLADIADDVAFANGRYDQLRPGSRLRNWHLHLGPIAWLIGRIRIERAMRSGSVTLLGRGLHGVQDYHAHGWFGEKHLLYRMKLLERHPDRWKDTPESIRGRIEYVSRRTFERFALRHT